MKTLYVGCALRGAPTEFVTGVSALKHSLEAWFSVVHFIGLNAAATNREIYAADIGMAAAADLMLAIVDVPSTGLGMEIARRHELGKETIIAYHKNAYPSAMVLGLAEELPYFTVLTYADHADLLTQMRAYA